METEIIQETATCQICHTELQKKEPDMNDLDINNLSLLAMFNIQRFHILECPACKKSGVQIN